MTPSAFPSCRGSARAFVATSLLLSTRMLPAAAHLSSVCSATHGSRPQSVTFLYGTYHSSPSAGSSVPGTAFVQNPLGGVDSFAFSSFCNMQDNGVAIGRFSDSVDDYKEKLVQNGCLCDKVLGCGGYDAASGLCTSTDSACVGVNPSHTVIQCFSGDEPVPIELGRFAKTLPNPDSHGCGYTTSSDYTAYVATVTGIQSGTFLVWSSGTDMNLDTSSNMDPPCNMAVGNPISVMVSVADGGGECLSAPSVPTGPECIPSANNTIPSGFVCPSACPDGEVSVGAYTCSNGAWPAEAVCLNVTKGACSASDVGDFGDSIVGVTGDDCNQLTGEGTSCQLVCAEGTWGGGTVTCKDTRDPNASTTTTTTTTTQAPSGYWYWYSGGSSSGGGGSTAPNHLAWEVDNSTFLGCSAIPEGVDYTPNLDITVGVALQCDLPGKLLVDWTFSVVSVQDGFDQITGFDLEPEDSLRVTCGSHTGSRAPSAGIVCTAGAGYTSSRVRVRGCNSAGCGNWSAFSDEAEPLGDEGGDDDSDGICNSVDVCRTDAANDADNDGVCDSSDSCPGDTANDADGDGICGAVDSCPEDARNDANTNSICDGLEGCDVDDDSDGVCDGVDSCQGDAENDPDGDGVCEGVDACPRDAANDGDSDGVCDGVDSCQDDAENDPDADGVCATEDSCPGDAENDADEDGVCEGVDACPGDAANDGDSDGICDGVDSCQGDAENDPDADGVCATEDSCPGDAENDADEDGVCEGVDACPGDAANDGDSDGVCDGEDSCPGDRDNDPDGDGICGAVDSCPGDVFNDADSDRVCEGVDACPGDAANDGDSDGVCDGVDSCLGDDLNDSDADGICDRVDSCPSDADNDEDSDGLCEPALASALSPEQELGLGLGLGLGLLLLLLLILLLWWCLCARKHQRERKVKPTTPAAEDETKQASGGAGEQAPQTTGPKSHGAATNV